MKAKTNYVFSYYALSSFFCVFFFIVPLYYVYLYGANYLGIRYEISNSELAWLIFSLLLFFLGFVSFDVFNRVLPVKSEFETLVVKTEPIRNRTPIVVIILGIVVFSWLTLDVFLSSAEETYAIRRGETTGSLLDFFMLQIFNACKFTLVILLLYFGKKKYLLLLLVFVVFTLLVKSSGRLSLLINFLLFFGLVSNIKSYKLTLLLTPLLIIFFPIVLYLKAIIYDFSINGNVDLYSALNSEFDWNSYLMNFGHPLFSFLSVDKTLDLIGYRYFYDYIQGFIFYFKLIGLDFGDSITYFNTESILGVRESIIPPGYFALGYVQLSFLGVFFSGFLYRFIGHLGWLLYNKSFGNTNNNVAIFYISFICANSFYHGDVRIFVMTVFFPFLFLLLFLKFIKKGER